MILLSQRSKLKEWLGDLVALVKLLGGVIFLSFASIHLTFFSDGSWWKVGTGLIGMLFFGIGGVYLLWKMFFEKHSQIRITKVGIDYKLKKMGKGLWAWNQFSEAYLAQAIAKIESIELKLWYLILLPKEMIKLNLDGDDWSVLANKEAFENLEDNREMVIINLGTDEDNRKIDWIEPKPWPEVLRLITKKI
jgi:hypothetical protein